MRVYLSYTDSCTDWISSAQGLNRRREAELDRAAGAGGEYDHREDRPGVGRHNW